MRGVTWDERGEDDWLASNGRWYPRSSWPRNWSMTALPPAPDHDEGGVGGMLRAVRNRIDEAIDGGDSTPPPRPSSAPTGAATPSGSGAAAAERGSSSGGSAPGTAPSGPPATRQTTADATITSQRTYARPLTSKRPPPPAALAPPENAPGPPPPAASSASASADAPPPPGRIRDDAPHSPAPTSDGTTLPAPAPPATVSVIAGDLGRVFGAARAKIEERIEEAIESTEGR